MEKFLLIKEESEQEIKLIVSDINKLTLEDPYILDEFDSFDEAVHFARLYRTGYELYYPTKAVTLTIK